MVNTPESKPEQAEGWPRTGARILQTSPACVPGEAAPDRGIVRDPVDRPLTPEAYTPQLNTVLTTVLGVQVACSTAWMKIVRLRAAPLTKRLSVATPPPLATAVPAIVGDWTNSESPGQPGTEVGVLAKPETK